MAVAAFLNHPRGWPARLRQGWDVLSILVTREFSIRYKGSLLGVAWASLSPLGTVVIMDVLFSHILSLNIPHYAAFIYSGLMPWNWFQTAIHTGAATLIDNRDLVRKPFFFRPLLPAVVTTTNFLLYLAALPVLLGLLLSEGISLSVCWLALPLVWLILAAYILGFTLFFSAIRVVVRDVQHILDLVMLLWFYMTPIFYDRGRLGAQWAWWLGLNPLTAIVEAHRDLVLYGRWPDWTALGWSAVAALGLIVIAAAIFHFLEDQFVEEV